MKPSITTKTGDKGQTRLFSGEEVPKYSPRPDCYGDMDELVSILGLARIHCRHEDASESCLQVQRDLFLVGSEIATTPGKLNRLPRRVDEAFLARMDATREALEEKIPAFRGFTVPGSCPSSAYFDVARAVSRRFERKVARLFHEGELTNQYLLVYVNRLSDFLYLLARYEEDKPVFVNPEQSSEP